MLDGKKLWSVTNAKESEQTLLGGLLLESELFSHIDKILCCNDFEYPTHQKIFDTMRRVYKKYRNFDVPMIADELPEDRVYLYQLANECCSTKNIVAHAEIIREKAVQRQLAECIYQMRLEESRPCKKTSSEGCPLGNFFIELGHEVNATQLSVDYLREILIEINKAAVRTLEELEDEEG